MRKLVIILLVFLAVVTIIRAIDISDDTGVLTNASNVYEQASVSNFDL